MPLFRSYPASQFPAPGSKTDRFGRKRGFIEIGWQAPVTFPLQHDLDKRWEATIRAPRDAVRSALASQVPSGLQPNSPGFGDAEYVDRLPLNSFDLNYSLRVIARVEEGTRGATRLSVSAMGWSRPGGKVRALIDGVAVKHSVKRWIRNVNSEARPGFHIQIGPHLRAGRHNGFKIRSGQEVARVRGKDIVGAVKDAATGYSTGNPWSDYTCALHHRRRGHAGAIKAARAIL
jgi:hypothetical protein